jgi:phage tail sheath protein FI
MPITPTYPGLYIEELPSNARTITAAPTSITVIVGYTHPFKTRDFGRAVQVFSFADYEREFGGLYTSGALQNFVAHAVNNFFLNGGSNAYVVGLEPLPRRVDGSVITDLAGGHFPQAEATLGGVVFSGLEPTDQIEMTVTIDNLQNGGSIADITIGYGTRAETFRGVTLSTADTVNFIETRLNGVSTLVEVRPGADVYGATFTAGTRVPLLANISADFATTFSADDFTSVIRDDTSLDKVPIFNLLLMPGVTDNAVWSAALAFCERKHAFVILDPPPDAAADGSFGLPMIADIVNAGTLPTSTNGALYFPYLRSSDPLTNTVALMPPSGFVAGLYARTDVNRGVWKAPAGMETIILNTLGVAETGVLTDQRHGTLNLLGINAIRTFPGIGTVIFGARTQVTANPAFQQWRYVPVRRMALFIQQTLRNNLSWAIFEPNSEPLWVAIRTNVDSFMQSLFNQGAFQGTRPSQAFRVVCDATTTTQQDIDNGIVNIIVAFAPLKPAEFVIIKISQLAGQQQQ